MKGINYNPLLADGPAPAAGVVDTVMGSSSLSRFFLPAAEPRADLLTAHHPLFESAFVLVYSTNIGLPGPYMETWFLAAF